VKEATATVDEGGGAGEASRAHGAEERSGEARAACRGDPRRRLRAPAERSVGGPARGPAREDQAISRTEGTKKKPPQAVRNLNGPQPRFCMAN